MGRLLVNPSNPLGMNDFARLYLNNDKGLSPEQVESDLASNAPLEGRQYLDSQWGSTAPGRKGISPVSFFNDIQRSRVAPTTYQSTPSPVMQGRTFGPKPLQGYDVLTGNADDDATVADNQLARGGSSLRDILLSVQNPTVAKNFQMEQERRILTGQQGTTRLAPVTEDQLLEHPKFSNLLQTNPGEASRVFTAATGSDLKETITRRRKMMDDADGLATSTYKTLATEGKLKYGDSGEPLIAEKDLAGQTIWKPAEGPLLQMILRAESPNRFGGTKGGFAAPVNRNPVMQMKLKLMSMGHSAEDAYNIIKTKSVQASAANTVEATSGATLANSPALDPTAQRTKDIATLQNMGRPVGELGAQLMDTGANTIADIANMGIGAGNLVRRGVNLFGGNLQPHKYVPEQTAFTDLFR